MPVLMTAPPVPVTDTERSRPTHERRVLEDITGPVLLVIEPLANTFSLTGPTAGREVGVPAVDRLDAWGPVVLNEVVKVHSPLPIAVPFR